MKTDEEQPEVQEKINTEMLKLEGETVREIISILLNKCLHVGRISTKWGNSELILLFKTGDNTNIEKYRHVSLLLHLYNLFTKMITKFTFKTSRFLPTRVTGGIYKGL